MGIRSPGGVVERVVRKGVEPKASTLVMFTGDGQFTASTSGDSPSGMTCVVGTSTSRAS